MKNDTKKVPLSPERKLILSAVAVTCLILALTVLVSWYSFTRHDVLVLSSPDGSYQIVVRQSKVTYIDRNFDVILIDKRDNKERVIFSSQDQSPMIKEEHFIWTDDSQHVALIGDRYFVALDSELPNGLIVFLVYNLGDETLYCNTDHKSKLPRISAQNAIKIFGDRITSPP